jgi:hypothetical protein
MLPAASWQRLLPQGFKIRQAEGYGTAHQALNCCQRSAMSSLLPGMVELFTKD